MGFFSGIGKWLQKKGSTGSIARWVIKHYKQLKTHEPSLEDEEIAAKLFDIRYSSIPPKKDEKERFKKV